MLGGYLWGAFGDVGASSVGLGGFYAAGVEEVAEKKRVLFSKREALGSLVAPLGA